MNDHEPEQAIDVSPDRVVTMRLFVLVAILAFVATTTLAYAAMTTEIGKIKESTVSATAAALANAERIRIIERTFDKDFAELRADVRWLRENAEADRKTRPSGR